MSTVLLPSFTVAEWGGIHEYTVAASSALISYGCRVVAVVRQGRIADHLAALGADVVTTDWGDLDHLSDTLTERFRGKIDLVFAQPQASRYVGIKFARRAGIPTFVLLHGYYSDQAHSWSDFVEGVGGVAGAITSLLAGYCRIDPWKVSLVPNGIPDAIFESAVTPFESRIEDGIARIVLASRLEPDKSNQWDVLERILDADRDRSIRWQVRIAGDGSLRSDLERRYSRYASDGLDIRFLGLLSPEEVAREYSGAVLAIGAGRSALLSLASGTPTLGVGKYCATGMADQAGLLRGLWANFGDYPTHADSDHPLFTPVPELNIARLSDEHFAHARHARLVLSHIRRQSLCDQALFGFLGL